MSTGVWHIHFAFTHEKTRHRISHSDPASIAEERGYILWLNNCTYLLSPVYK